MRSNLSLQVKATDILAECDKLRDITLPDLGVLLEDKEGEETVCDQAGRQGGPQEGEGGEAGLGGEEGGRAIT